MGKPRTISKTCGKCGGNVAVACKSCTLCSYVFAAKKGGIESRKKETGSRLSRQSIKPNFYDPNQYEKKKSKKKNLKTRLNPNKTVDYSEDKEKEDDSHGQRMRGDLRPRRKIIKKDPEQTEDEEIAKLPLDKQELANLILQEINRKYTSVMGQPA